MKKDSILYIDTSGQKSEILLWQDGKVISDLAWDSGRDLSVTLFENVKKIINESLGSQKEITGICVFEGPGSFTGLRIGISFANAYAYGLGVPIYATRKKREIDFSSPKNYVIPNYGAEPNITQPKAKN